MSDKKLSHEEFVELALKKLPKRNFVSFHTVYSTFNDAFRAYFPDDDPVKVTKKLEEAGKISMRPSRGGALIGPPGHFEKPPSKEEVLGKMGLTQ